VKGPDNGVSPALAIAPATFHPSLVCEPRQGCPPRSRPSQADRPRESPARSATVMITGSLLPEIGQAAPPNRLDRRGRLPSRSHSILHQQILAPLLESS